MDAEVDLVAASREHLSLLRAVHLCQRDLYNKGDDLNQAISVYVDSWLPSLCCCADSWRPPTLDVAWVWHLHKTDPASYERDCMRWFGRVLDAPPGMSPFYHSGTLSSQLGDDKMSECSRIDDDLVERISTSAKNQSSFLWHVRWPEYDDTEFLRESVTRYKMMLELMRENPNQFIVPTYDIDLIWHTHLAFPSLYLENCIKSAGRKIHHDDNVGHDRSPSSFLVARSAMTEQLWQSTFGTSWRKKGAMYRGEPPTWYWSDRKRASTSTFVKASSATDLDISDLSGDGGTPTETKVTSFKRYRTALAHHAILSIKVVGCALGFANDGQVRFRTPCGLCRMSS